MVVVYFGDGASSEGDFHEACNLAGVVSAPVIFFLQNNGWAISTPRSAQSAASDLSARAPGYGFPGVSVDGNDLLAVHAVTETAVKRALAGDGPTLIEAHTYRRWAHTTADDPSRYVDAEEAAAWESRDPIERVERYLTGRAKWSDDIAATMQEQVDAHVEELFAKADAFAPPAAGEVYDHIFETPSPSLQRQRKWNLED